MRKIRGALRLRANGLTLREIPESLGLGRTTVGDHLHRAAHAGLTWPLDDALTDIEMDAQLFPPSSGVAASITQPDWAAIHLEYKRPKVTLMLLWEEYRVVHPPLGTLLRNALLGSGRVSLQPVLRPVSAPPTHALHVLPGNGWEGRLSPSMRQHHLLPDR
jgi:hypothetical protein